MSETRECIVREIRHLRQLRITPEAVAGFCTSRLVTAVQARGIPEGAKVVGVQWDGKGGFFILTLEHESFDRVLEGDPIPPITPEFMRWLNPSMS
jgi:hypothetical protein